MVVTFKWENDDDDKGVEGNDGNYDDDDEEHDEEEGEQGVAETIKRENENQRKKLKSKEETKE